MKSLTFSYSTCDLTDPLFMRYFRKRDLIQNLLSTKLFKFDFQYHYVSLDAQVQFRTSTFTSTNQPLVDINYCSFKVLVLLLVSKLLEL